MPVGSGAHVQCGGSGDDGGDDGGGDVGGDGDWGDDGGDDGGDGGDDGGVYTTDDGTMDAYADGLDADSLCTNTGQRCSPRAPNNPDSSAAQRAIDRLLNSSDRSCAALGQTLLLKFNNGTLQFFDQPLVRTVRGQQYQTDGLAFRPQDSGNPQLAGRILVYSGTYTSGDKQHVMFHEAAHFQFGNGDTNVSNPSYPYNASAEQVADYCEGRTAAP